MTKILYGLAIVVLALIPSDVSGQDSTLVALDNQWHYHASNVSPPSEWREVDFDVSTWPIGPSGFGFGDQDDATVLSAMQGQFSRVQIRTQFEVSDPRSIKRLYFYINYDDGFVAYLNGREVARRNVSNENVGFAAGNHEVAGFEEMIIPDANMKLNLGKNILAVEGFNRSIESSDFSLQPMLAVRRQANWIGVSSRVFPSGKSVPVIHRSNAPYTIGRDTAIAAVNELQRRIEDQSSYVQMNRFDREKAFGELRDCLPNPVTVFQLAEKLQRLIARIGDCHARVDVPVSDPDSLYLPFMLADTSDGVVALETDRSALIDADHPFVSAIDGVPFERWLDIASAFVAKGSPQLVRNRSLSVVRRIDLIQRHLGLDTSEQITVTLRSRVEGRTQNRMVDLHSRAAPIGRIPIARTRQLNDNIGYLRIDQMDNGLKKSVVQQMQDFRETTGLVIDVRDNGGGRYGLMHLLHGYLTPADAPPYVTNIAAYRKSELFAENHLHYRPTYRESFEGWNARQRQAIRTARENFDPEWNPPSQMFSQWHYMVIEKTPNVGQYHYDKPVVVLCNAGSFSATDGFLSCMADLPGVTLLGEPSSGGSGSTQHFTLPDCGLRVALSSMASFRPNGRLFDGNGVEVDIEMKPTIDDYRGKTDTVLSKAIEMIKDQTR